MKPNKKTKALLKKNSMKFSITEVSPPEQYIKFPEVVKNIYRVLVYENDEKAAQFYITDDSLLDKKIEESITYLKKHET